MSLVVTSPPFLDVVNYAGDNWLRGWFCGIDTSAVEISMHRKVADWQAAMTSVFRELARVLRPGGHVAFEVGEVRGGKVKLEEAVLPCGVGVGPRAAARRHQRAAVHQDRELLGRPQQLEGHEHEPDCGVPEELENYGRRDRELRESLQDLSGLQSRVVLVLVAPHRLVLGIERLEHRQQLGDRQQILQLLGDVRELQRCRLRASPSCRRSRARQDPRCRRSCTCARLKQDVLLALMQEAVQLVFQQGAVLAQGDFSRKIEDRHCS